MISLRDLILLITVILTGAGVLTFRYDPNMMGMWIENFTAMSQWMLRSRNCDQMAGSISGDCQRAQVRWVDPVIVSAAEDLEYERVIMAMALRTASIPKPISFDTVAGDEVEYKPPHKRKAASVFEDHIMLMPDLPPVDYTEAQLENEARGDSLRLEGPPR